VSAWAYQRGAASVEHVGLAMLIALALLAAVAAFAAGPPVEESHSLGTAITRKLRCAPRLPGPCWRDPLTDAYGRPLAGLVRALAPAPAPRAGPGGLPLLGVDFRHCRQPSCAVSTGSPRLTASNRRTTAFSSVEDDRHAGGDVRVRYWIYRPVLGWELAVRRADSDDVAAAADTPLLDSANPKLVPLETLAGRNHYDFPRSEEPPWRWRVEPVYPG
jgi:Flp pilus assembly pilin Flp